MRGFLLPAPRASRLAAAGMGVCLAFAPASAGADAGSRGSLALFPDQAHKTILARTILSGDLTGGEEKERAVLTEFITGGSEAEKSIDILLAVLPAEPTDAPALWTQDYGAALGGPVAGGELSLVDIDGDSRPEIIVTLHQNEDPGCVRVIGEVLREAGGSFFVGWTGTMRLDTAGVESRAPSAERERFSREIEFDRTLATRGGMIFLRKRVSLAAGVPIDPPKIIEESFPLALPGPR